jgi:hypothetical protein
MGRSNAALVACATFFLSLTAWADDPMTVNRSSKAGTVVASESEQVTAIVTAVDQAKRQVSLQGPNGKIESMHVDDAVKNFSQLKVGDAVLVQFYRGLALTLQPPGSQSVAPQGEAVAGRAASGEKPAGAVGAVIRGTVTVKAIDVPTRIVTLVGPEGREFRVKAGPDVRLSNVKLGDKVFAEYGEALAISVQPTR